MQKNFYRSQIWVFVSGLLTFVVVCEINFILAWVCFVPLFIWLTDKSSKQIFRSCFVFGIAFSIPAFFWMIPGAEKFTGHNIIYGIGVFLIALLFLSLFFGCLLYCFGLLKFTASKKNGVVLNAVLIAA